jgi:hypothetical protein
MKTTELIAKRKINVPAKKKEKYLVNGIIDMQQQTMSTPETPNQERNS